MKKAKCEIASQFCSGQGVTLMSGTKKDDPKFHACLACIAILRRQGVKLVQVPRGQERAK